MGKFRVRVKGKGKSWRKGQSSSSNPTTKTHRVAARSRFFQENLTGKSKLTSDALEKHDAFLGLEKSDHSIDVDGQTDITGTFSSFKTFKTFATDWSECTNVSFNRLLLRFDSKSALHKEMLAVLAAVTEVIKAKGGKETSTEYFAALITTLEASEDEQNIAATVSLLGMGIKTVPQNVLRLKFSEFSKTFVHLLVQYAGSSNNNILRQLIGCTSVLLRAQDAMIWTDSSTMQVFDSILSFSIHSKPKVRKAAQHAVCSVLKGSSFMVGENAPNHHPAAIHVAKFCIHHLEMGTSMGGFTTALHILVLLKEILGCFPKINLKQNCESILKIMTLGNVLVLSNGMEALHGLFTSQPSRLSLSGELNAQLISALFDYQPAVTDQQPTLAWLAVMQEAYVNLGRLDLHLWCANLPRFFSVATNLWLCERSEIISGATVAMEKVLEISLKEACAPSNINVYKNMLQKVIQCAEEGLKYQYHTAWPYVLHLLGTIFELSGETCYDILLPCIKTLGELSDADQFTYKNELENAVGQAIKSMGPDKVLGAIPLQITGNETNYEFKRSWLLPVLKDNIHGASLKSFISYFLPLAATCRKQAETSKNEVAKHSYDLLQSQIWSLLPSFCNNPPDLQENFKAIAKMLGVIIADYKDIRLPVMMALRRLIVQNQENYNEGNLNELKKFAKNYLPILFNVYTTKPSGTEEKDQNQAVLETIKVYLTIATPDLHTQLYDKACENLDSTLEDFTKESILDLVRCLIPYQNPLKLEELFIRIKKEVTGTDSHRQKKHYRLLEEICGNNSENCRKFVKEHFSSLQELLVNTLSTCAPSTRAPRLRCLIYLVQQMQNGEADSLEQILPEAILCCKDINEKCRIAANKLLVLIGEAMEAKTGSSKSDALEDFVKLILAGLSGPNTLVSATVLALEHVFFEFKGRISDSLQKIVFDNICLLAVSSAREIVASALSFIKKFTVATSLTSLGPYVPTIVKSLLAMTEDCKRHFRLRSRDVLDRLIKKFGYSAIAGLVPDDDLVMHKRLRNLRKIHERKKKGLKNETGDSDQEDLFNIRSNPKTFEEILEDSDFEQAPTNEPKASKLKKHKTWIHESADTIVDFMDVGAATKIVASLPSATDSTMERKKKNNNMPFKMSSEGRLIITDLNDSEDEGERRKVLIPNEDSDEDIDNLSRAESTKEFPIRKRKLTIGSDTCEPAPKYQAGGSGIHRPLAQTKRKSVSKGPKVATGEAYRAKKAKGDLKKKGLPDPYAYVPLSRKLLNRRKKMKNAGQFKNLIHAAKKGAQKGRLAKKRNKMRK